MEVCKYCGYNHFIKYGLYARDRSRQKYQCMNCYRVIVEQKGSVNHGK